MRVGCLEAEWPSAHSIFEEVLMERGRASRGSESLSSHSFVSDGKRARRWRQKLYRASST